MRFIRPGRADPVGWWPTWRMPRSAGICRWPERSRTPPPAMQRDADRTDIEQAAELGLAKAVLAWRERTGAGFRRFARSSIIRELSSR